MEENLSSDYSSKNSIFQNNLENSKPKEEEKSGNTISFSKIISELLTDICEEGKSNLDSKLTLLKPFISKKIPNISIFEYIERLLKYSKASNELLIIVLIYLDTICAKHKINLNYYNIHKLFLAAFISAIKFYEDEYYSLNYYAKLGGISKKELINLEYEFLNLMDFQLFVKQELYEKYYNNLFQLQNEDDEEDIFEDWNDKEICLKNEKKYKNLNYYIMKLLVVNIEEFKV